MHRYLHEKEMYKCEIRMYEQVKLMKILFYYETDIQHTTKEY